MNPPGDKMKKALLLLFGFLIISPIQARDFSFATSAEFPATSSITFLAMNNSNYMVGSYSSVDPNINELRNHGFIFSQGILTLDLDYPGARDTAIRAVNNAGVAVGSARLFDFANNRLLEHGLILDGDGFQLLDYPEALQTTLEVISNNGLIGGLYLDQFGSRGYFSYNLRTGKFKELNARLGGTTTMDSINNIGIISGSTNDVSKAYRLRTSNNQLTISQTPNRAVSALLSPGGNPRIFAGRYLDPQGGMKGYLSRNGALINIMAPGADGTSVTGINNKTQLSLYGIKPGVGYQAYQYDIKTREYSMLNVNPVGESKALAINANGNIGGAVFGPNNAGLRVFVGFPQ